MIAVCAAAGSESSGPSLTGGNPLPGIEADLEVDVENPGTGSCTSECVECHDHL